MAVTYESIATTTLGSAQATITFSSIAASWTDLRLVVVGASSVANDTPSFKLNGDSGSNYSWTDLKGDGANSSSQRGTNSTVGIRFIGPGVTSTTIPFVGTADIFSYTGSTYKTALTSFANDKNGSGYVARTVGLYRSTSAITSITLFWINGNDFTVGTTATLYGIKAA